MTDNSKSTSGEGPIKPQVIDLEAEDVTVNSEPAPPPPAPPPPARKSNRSLAYGAAILIAGLIAGGWFYRDVLSSYIPTSAMTALQSRVDTLEAANKTASEQLLAVSTAAEDAKSVAAALDQAVKDATAAAADAKASTTAVSSRLDELAKLDTAISSLRSDLDTLRQTVTTAGSGTGSVDNAALAAIGQRLDTLEKDVASLKSSGGQATQDVAALSQALSDLKAKIAAGASYRAEYDRIFRMVPAAAGLDVLATHADAGLPTATGLAAKLSAGIPTLPKPDASQETGDGWVNSILGSLTGLITIRDIGEADWPDLAAKCAALAEANDLPQAIAIIDGAEGEKPSLIAQWRDRAAARLKLEAALGDTEKAVLRQIAVLGGAP